MQLKFLVVSHCGAMGHRGAEATESIIREHFIWQTLTQDCKDFVDCCIHSIVSRTGHKIPRPLATTLHGARPSEVVHLEYLYLGPSRGGVLYVLIRKDGFSGYVWLFSFEAGDGDSAVEAIIEWIASFGVMDWMVTNQGSHFRNKSVEALRKWFKYAHHFTKPYSPWANGTVERVCREVKRACLALLSEWKLSPRDWPSVVSSVQAILNQAPLKCLCARSKEEPRIFRTPLEVFCGM